MEKQENGPDNLHMLPKRKKINKNQKQNRKKIIQQHQNKIPIIWTQHGTVFPTTKEHVLELADLNIPNTDLY